jgi:hypothetical protein
MAARQGEHVTRRDRDTPDMHLCLDVQPQEAAGLPVQVHGVKIPTRESERHECLLEHERPDA